jgi:hypothetical protein
MRATRLAASAVTGASAVLLVAAASAAPAFAASPAPSAPSGSSVRAAASSGAAATCSADQLAYIKARVDLHVAQRQLTIRQLTSALAARTHVTDPHRATLTGLFTSDASGLAATDAKVQADTTCKQALSDGRTVVTSYRVYMLLAPQEHLVAASDTGTYGAGKLTAAEPKLQAGIAAITDPTKKAEAQAAYADLVAQTTSASDDFAGVGDSMLALVPADMPAAQSTVTAERSKVQAGRAALTLALKDAKTIATLL